MAGYNHLNLKHLYEEYRRKNRKVTKMDIVDSIGISKSSLENYIAGVSVPSADALYKIAIFFKVKVDHFFDYVEKDPMSRYSESKPNSEMVLNERPADYSIDSEGWKTAFETQKQLTEARVEIERLKKDNAVAPSAKAG